MVLNFQPNGKILENEIAFLYKNIIQKILLCERCSNTLLVATVQTIELFKYLTKSA